VEPERVAPDDRRYTKDPRNTAPTLACADFLVVCAVLRNQSPVDEFPVFGPYQGIFLWPRPIRKFANQKTDQLSVP
jgi:hypothetical protein